MKLTNPKIVISTIEYQFRVCCNAFEDSTFSSFHNTTAVVAYTSTVDVSVTIQYKASLDNFTALPTPSDYNAPCPSGSKSDHIVADKPGNAWLFFIRPIDYTCQYDVILLKFDRII